MQLEGCDENPKTSNTFINYIREKSRATDSVVE